MIDKNQFLVKLNRFRTNSFTVYYFTDTSIICYDLNITVLNRILIYSIPNYLIIQVSQSGF